MSNAKSPFISKWKETLLVKLLNNKHRFHGCLKQQYLEKISFHNYVA